MTIIDTLFDWLAESPGYTGVFENVRGVWVASSSDQNQRYASLTMLPGGNFDSLLERGSVRLLLLGVENDQDVVGLEQFALDLRKRLQTDYKACGIAQILLVGGIIGPGQTEEGRPWYEMNFSVISE